MARSVKGGTKTGRSARRSGARPGRRNARPARGRFARRVGWRRRLAISAVLLFLVGITIAFAGSTLRDQPVRNAPSAPPSPQLSPTPAPTPAPTRDRRAPTIDVNQPAPGATIYTDTITLRGQTEAGADIDVLDEATGEHLPADLNSDGRFTASIPLEVGHNWMTLTSRDVAGNVGRQRVDIVRTASSARAELVVEPTQVDLATLPQRMQISASITNDVGAPADDVQVTFSVSPPNAATMTYAATTSHGHASWPNLVVNDDGLAGGQWLVTVLAVLPTGNEVRANASFSVR